MKAADLTVSTGSHWHSGAKITDFSYNTLLALVPAIAMGMYRYGVSAAGVIGTAMASAMIAEAAMQKLLGKPVRIADGSAAVSGLLLALLLPANTPAYMVIVASVIGITIGKLCFGGLGANPLSPALVGWAVLRITKPWAGYLDFDLALINYDLGFSMQYPLAVLKASGALGIQDFNTWNLFLGNQTGGIGASAIVCVLGGGLYMVARGLVRWEIPLCFLLGVVIASSLFRLVDSAANADPLFHIVTGNVMIGALFLSTDNSSAPINRWGMVAFGLCCGMMTVVLRAWSVYPDGVVFACLLMSLFVPLLDKLRASTIVVRPTNVQITGETVEGGTSS